MDNLRLILCVVLAVGIAAGCDRISSVRTVVALTHVRAITWTLEDTSVVNPVDIEVANGSIYLMDNGLPGVRQFTRDGALVRSYGRRGEGPGELRAISGFAVSPDGSIITADPANMRLTLFAADGRTASVAGLPPGRVGAIAIDAHGNIHVDRRGGLPIPSVPVASTIQVFSDVRTVIAEYGRYEAQDHPIADALHNQARFSSDGERMFASYVYRGLVLVAGREYAVVDTLMLGQPLGRDAGGPYVDLKPTDNPGGVFSIIRMPVVEDIAVRSNGELVASYLQGPRDGFRYHVVCYNSEGAVVGRHRLSFPADRLDIVGDTLYALSIGTRGAPGIQVYALEALQSSTEKGEHQ